MQVFIASFIGGPVCGGWCLKKNYDVLGEPERGLRSYRWASYSTTFIGVAIAILIKKYGTHVPEKIPSMYEVAPFYSAIMAGVCKFRQSKKIKEAIAEGKARKGSTGKLLLYSAGWLIATLSWLALVGMVTMAFLGIFDPVK
jgi:hypothetical protein